MGVGEVGGLDAADQQGVEFAVRGGLENAAGVAAGFVGQGGDVPGVSDLLARNGIGDRATAGQQGGQAAGVQCAALTGPPGDPGQLGSGLDQPGRG